MPPSAYLCTPKNRECFASCGTLSEELYLYKTGGHTNIDNILITGLSSLVLRCSRVPHYVVR